MRAPLMPLLARRLPPERLEPIAALPGQEALLVAFASAPRRVPREPLELDGAERAALAAAGIETPPARRLDELYRVVLLLRASEASWAPPPAELAAELFRTGDNEEREAVLRALPLLPGPAALVPLAVEACRTNVRDVFCAIACENPFAARHFTDPAFQQMVLKALFLEVSLERVDGLAARVTPELLRMAGDYASERRAAGRPVPDDIALLERLAAGLPPR